MLPADRRARMELPTPKPPVTLEAVSVTPPGTSDARRSRMSASTLKAGQGAGHHRPERDRASLPWRAPSSASGPPARGKIRIDGAALDQWSLGSSGTPSSAICRRTWSCSTATVAQNIARFEPDAEPTQGDRGGGQGGGSPRTDPATCRDGYETQIGENGACPLGGPASAHRRSPGRSTASRSWSSSTSPIPISTARATRP